MYCSVSCIHPISHFIPNPSPPRWVGRDTIGHTRHHAVARRACHIYDQATRVRAHHDVTRDRVLLNQTDRAVVDLVLQAGDVVLVARQCTVDRVECAADIVEGRALDRIARCDELPAAVERRAEGGRNPLKRFNDALEGCSRAEVDRFYCENFIDLMGEGLAEDLRRPKHLAAA